MKTYSVAIKNTNGDWLTNWHQYSNLDNIDWNAVDKFVKDRGDLGYGYYYGHNSRNLTSAKCRTVLYDKG